MFWNVKAGDNSISRVRVFEGHKQFSEDRDEIENDEHFGRTVPTQTHGKVHIIDEIVRKIDV